MFPPFKFIDVQSKVKLLLYKRANSLCCVQKKLEDSGDESEGCGRIKGTRREGSNATLLCHERKMLLAQSTEH